MTLSDRELSYFGPSLTKARQDAKKRWNNQVYEVKVLEKVERLKK